MVILEWGRQVSKKKPKTIDASCPVTLMGCEGEVIVEMAPTEAVSMLEKAWQENKRLRQENATITAERDEARRSCCEYAAIVDGADTTEGMESGRFYEIAMNYMKHRGWDCFKQDGMTDAEFLRYLAQNDYNIDGGLLADAVRLNEIADRIEKGHR